LGLPFLLVGAFVTYVTVSAMLESSRMQAWSAVPALIQEAKLETHESHDSATTYSVVARYTYDFGGTQYTGNRVSLSSGSDNIDSFHHDVFKELDTHRVNGTPFRAYVNPAEPAQSILFPESRMSRTLGSLVFGLVFAGTGGFLVLISLFTRKPKSPERPSTIAADVEPGERPWTERPEWRTGIIQSSAQGLFWLLGGFSLVWTAGSLGATDSSWRELRTGNLLGAVGLLFPLFGLLLFALSLYLFLQWRRFGVTTLRLKSTPIEPGKTLDGDIEVKAAIEPGATIQLALKCQKTHTEGTGKHRRTETKTLWQHEWKSVPRPMAGQRGTRIPVTCRIPPNAVETSAHSVSWNLSATAVLRGIDFGAQFEVPVFHLESGLDTLDEEEEDHPRGKETN